MPRDFSDFAVGLVGIGLFVMICTASYVLISTVDTVTTYEVVAGKCVEGKP